MTLSEQLMKEIEEGKAKKLMKAIASEIASDPELRALVVQAVLKDVATKEDLKALEERLERQMSELRQDIRELNRRFDTMLKWIIGMLVTMWITIVAGIIVALMKMG